MSPAVEGDSGGNAGVVSRPEAPSWSVAVMRYGDCALRIGVQLHLYRDVASLRPPCRSPLLEAHLSHDGTSSSVMRHNGLVGGTLGTYTGGEARPESQLHTLPVVVHVVRSAAAEGDRPPRCRRCTKVTSGGNAGVVVTRRPRPGPWLGDAVWRRCAQDRRPASPLPWTLLPSSTV